ncbi:hypothetical protein NL676_014065 [Syzygium grande]|nr:hypothetical protein NL676_014065 [Syzygium grande]
MKTLNRDMTIPPEYGNSKGKYTCQAERPASQVLVKNIYYKWFKFNVIRDVDASNVKIYMDDQLRYEVPGHGGPSHYFKLRVYAQVNSSHCMESRWKDAKVLKKNQLK